MGYDEPEKLHYAINSFCLTSADRAHSIWLKEGNRQTKTDIQRVPQIKNIGLSNLLLIPFLARFLAGNQRRQNAEES